MENNLQVFNFQENNQVRTIEQNGEAWFVAKDVCDILGLTNVTKALYALDNDEKSTLTLSKGTSPKGGYPKLNIISESGLYALILRSEKPNAKPFRKWITSEVLPSIRKSGTYSLQKDAPAYQCAELQEGVNNIKLRIEYWDKLKQLLREVFNFVRPRNERNYWYGVPPYMKYDKSDIYLLYSLSMAMQTFAQNKSENLEKKLETFKEAMVDND